MSESKKCDACGTMVEFRKVGSWKSFLMSGVGDGLGGLAGLIGGLDQVQLFGVGGHILVAGVGFLVGSSMFRSSKCPECGSVSSNPSS